MIATRVLLILSVLPMLSQAAPKPKTKQNGGQSSALQALFTNANMLREFTKIGMENYVRTNKILSDKVVRYS